MIAVGCGAGLARAHETCGDNTYGSTNRNDRKGSTRSLRADGTELETVANEANTLGFNRRKLQRQITANDALFLDNRRLSDFIAHLSEEHESHTHQQHQYRQSIADLRDQVRGLQTRIEEQGEENQQSRAEKVYVNTPVHPRCMDACN